MQKSPGSSVAASRSGLALRTVCQRLCYQLGQCSSQVVRLFGHQSSQRNLPRVFPAAAVAVAASVDDCDTALLLQATDTARMCLGCAQKLAAKGLRASLLLYCTYVHYLAALSPMASFRPGLHRSNALTQPVVCDERTREAKLSPPTHTRTPGDIATDNRFRKGVLQPMRRWLLIVQLWKTLRCNLHSDWGSAESGG